MVRPNNVKRNKHFGAGRAQQKKRMQEYWAQRRQHTQHTQQHDTQDPDLAHHDSADPAQELPLFSDAHQPQPTQDTQEAPQPPQDTQDTQEAPQVPQEAPQPPQDTQEAPQVPQEAPQVPQEAPQDTQEAPQVPQTVVAPPVQVRVGGTRQKAKPHRYRPGVRALMEIRKEQKNYSPVVPRAPLIRIFKEIMHHCTRTGVCRVTSTAVDALREGLESYAVGLFEDTNLCAIHAKRQTIMPRDMRLAMTIRREEPRP